MRWSLLLYPRNYPLYPIVYMPIRVASRAVSVGHRHSRSGTLKTGLFTRFPRWKSSPKFEPKSARTRCRLIFQRLFANAPSRTRPLKSAAVDAITRRGRCAIGSYCRKRDHDVIFSNAILQWLTSMSVLLKQRPKLDSGIQSWWDGRGRREGTT